MFALFWLSLSTDHHSVSLYSTAIKAFRRTGLIDPRRGSGLKQYRNELPQCSIRIQSVSRTIAIYLRLSAKRPIVFSLDGERIRGIVRLGLLRALEKRLGIRIAQKADLCTEASVGTWNRF